MKLVLEVHISAGEGGERGGAAAEKPSSSLGGEHAGGENLARLEEITHLKVEMTY